METIDFSKYAGSYSLKEAREVSKKLQADIFEAEKRQDLINIEKMHGDKYTYELRKGVAVDLTQLNKNQSVCASQIKGHHFLLTEKD